MQADDDFDTRVTRPRVRSLLLDLTEEDFARGWVGRRSDPSTRSKVEENAATAGDAPPTRRSRVLTIVVGTVIAAVLGSATGIAVSLRRPTVTAQFLHHSCLSIEDTMRQPHLAITVEAETFQTASATGVEELLPPPEPAAPVPPKRVIKPVAIVKAAPPKPVEEPQVATATDPEPEVKPAASATATPAPAEPPPAEPPPTPVEDKFP